MGFLKFPKKRFGLQVAAGLLSAVLVNTGAQAINYGADVKWQYRGLGTSVLSVRQVQDAESEAMLRLLHDLTQKSYEPQRNKVLDSFKRSDVEVQLDKRIGGLFQNKVYCRAELENNEGGNIADMWVYGCTVESQRGRELQPVNQLSSGGVILVIQGTVGFSNLIEEFAETLRVEITTGNLLGSPTTALVRDQVMSDSPTGVETLPFFVARYHRVATFARNNLRGGQASIRSYRSFSQRGDDYITRVVTGDTTNSSYTAGQFDRNPDDQFTNSFSPANNVIAVGHSLGGVQAQLLGYEYIKGNHWRNGGRSRYQGSFRSVTFNSPRVYADPREQFHYDSSDRAEDRIELNRIEVDGDLIQAHPFTFAGQSTTHQYYSTFRSVNAGQPQPGTAVRTALRLHNIREYTPQQFRNMAVGIPGKPSIFHPYRPKG